MAVPTFYTIAVVDSQRCQAPTDRRVDRDEFLGGAIEGSR
jgi:hypothetical protein